MSLFSMGCFEEFAVGHSISSEIADSELSSVEILSVSSGMISSSSFIGIQYEDESVAHLVSSQELIPVFQSSSYFKPLSSSSTISSFRNAYSSQVLSSSTDVDSGILSFGHEDNDISPSSESSTFLAMEVINSLSDSVFVLNETTLNIGGIYIRNIESIIKDTTVAQEDENILTQYNFVGKSGVVMAKLVCLQKLIGSDANYQLSEFLSKNGMPYKRRTFTFNENQELLQSSFQIVFVGEYSFYFPSGVFNYEDRPERIYFTPATDEVKCRDTKALSIPDSQCDPILSIEAGVIETANFYNGQSSL